MEPATGTPLLLLQLPFLRALEPVSGRLLWETLVGDAGSSSSAPGRLFVTPQGLFVMAGRRIWLVDVATGKLTLGIELPFAPDSAVLDGGCFYLAAGAYEAAAVGVDGRLRWAVKLETGLLSGKVVCRDADGQVVWDRKIPPGTTSSAPGIALGSKVAQPDDKGM